MSSYLDWFRDFRNCDVAAYPAGVQLAELTEGVWEAVVAPSCGTPHALNWIQTVPAARLDPACQITPGDWRQCQALVSILRWIATGFWPEQAGYRWGDATGANAVQTWWWPILAAGYDAEQDLYFVEIDCPAGAMLDCLTWNGAFGEGGQEFTKTAVGPGWQMRFTGPCVSVVALVHHVERGAVAGRFRLFTLSACAGATSGAPEAAAPWIGLTYWAPDFLPGWIHPRDPILMHAQPWCRRFLRSELDPQGRIELLTSAGAPTRIAPATWGAELLRVEFGGGAFAGDQTAALANRIGIVQEPTTRTHRAFLHFGPALPDGTPADDLRGGWSWGYAIYFHEVPLAAEGDKITIPGRCQHCRRDYGGGWSEPTPGANGIAADGSRWFCDARGAEPPPTGLAEFIGGACFLQGRCSHFALNEHWLRGTQIDGLLRQLRGGVDVAERQTMVGLPFFHFLRLGTPGLHVLTSPTNLFSSPPTTTRRQVEIADAGPYVSPAVETVEDDDGNEDTAYTRGGVCDATFGPGFFADADDEIGSLQSSLKPTLMDDADDPEGGRRAWPNRRWPKLVMETETGLCQADGTGEALVQRVGHADGRHELIIAPDAFAVDGDGLNGWPAPGEVAHDPGALTWSLQVFQSGDPTVEIGGVPMGAVFRIGAHERRIEPLKTKLSATIAKVTSLGGDLFSVELRNRANEAAKELPAIPGGHDIGPSMTRLEFWMGGHVVAPPDAKRLNNWGLRDQWAWWGTPEQSASPGDTIRLDGSGVPLPSLGEEASLDDVRFWIVKAEAFAGDAEPWTGSPQRTAEGQVAGFLDMDVYSEIRGWAREEVFLHVHSWGGDDVSSDAGETRPLLANHTTAPRFWWDEEHSRLFYNSWLYLKNVSLKFQHEGVLNHTYDFTLNAFPRVSLSEQPAALVSVSYLSDGIPLTIRPPDWPHVAEKGDCSLQHFGGEDWVQFSFDDTGEAMRIVYEFPVGPNVPPDVVGKPNGWDDYASKRDVLTVRDELGLLATYGAGLVGKELDVTQEGVIGPEGGLTVWLGPNAADVRVPTYDVTAHVAVRWADGLIYLPTSLTDALDHAGHYCLAAECDVANRRGQIGAKTILSLVKQIDSCRTLTVGGGIGFAREEWASVLQIVGAPEAIPYANAGGHAAAWDTPGLPDAGQCVSGMRWGDYAGVSAWWDLLLNWRYHLNGPGKGQGEKGGWPDGADWHYWGEKTLANRTHFSSVPFARPGADPEDGQPFIDRDLLPVIGPRSTGLYYPQDWLTCEGEAYIRNGWDGVPQTDGGLIPGTYEAIGFPASHGCPVPENHLGFGGSGFAGAGIAPGGTLIYCDRGAGWRCPVFRVSLDARLMRLPDDAQIEHFRVAITASGGGLRHDMTWVRSNPVYDGFGRFDATWVANGATLDHVTSEVNELCFDMMLVDQNGEMSFGGSTLTVPCDGKRHVHDLPGLLQTLLTLKGGRELDGGFYSVPKEVLFIPGIDTAAEHPGVPPTSGSMLAYMDRYTWCDLKVVSELVKPYLGRGVVGKWWKALVDLGAFQFRVDFLDVEFRLGDRWKRQPIDYEALPRMDILEA